MNKEELETPFDSMPEPSKKKRDPIGDDMLESFFFLMENHEYISKEAILAVWGKLTSAIPKETIMEVNNDLSYLDSDIQNAIEDEQSVADVDMGSCKPAVFMVDTMDENYLGE